MTTNKDAIVDPDYFWQPIDTCPTGPKVLLLNRAGLASTGRLEKRGDDWWIGWSPLPKIPPAMKEIIEAGYRPRSSNIGALLGD